jgi:hypothetical protein
MFVAQVGVLLARLLGRRLVLPVFTDVEPHVDVARYVSLGCFRCAASAPANREGQPGLKRSCRPAEAGV